MNIVAIDIHNRSISIPIATMVSCGKVSVWYAIAFFFTCGISDVTVLAKKTQDPTLTPTWAPTVTPSSSPTISISPSASPSKFHSLFPTISPSLTPSASPTTAPTNSPTQWPTYSPIKIEDSSSVTPTKSSRITTITPTPRSKPVRDETNSDEELTYTFLPLMTFGLILSEDISINELQAFVVDFLDGVLQQISDTYRFDYSYLDLNGIVSTFDQPQLSGAEFRVRMDGHVYYFDESPTEESLAQSLNVYFSFWGASDLQDYLINVGLGQVVVVSISIGGENVLFVSDVIQGEIQENQRDDNVAQDGFIEDGGDLSNSTVMMLYTGSVFVAVAFALLVCRHRIGRQRRKQDRQSKSQSQSDSNESRTSKNSGDSGGEEKGPSSNTPKIPSRKSKVTRKPSASRVTNAFEEPPILKSEKTSQDDENNARFGVF